MRGGGGEEEDTELMLVSTNKYGADKTDDAASQLCYAFSFGFEQQYSLRFSIEINGIRRSDKQAIALNNWLMVIP